MMHSARHCPLHAQAAHFLRDQNGAITVDWVVLTAAIVGLGVAAVSSVGMGIGSVAERIQTSLLSAQIGNVGALDPFHRAVQLIAGGPVPVTASTDRGAARQTDFSIEEVVGPDGEVTTALVWRDSVPHIAWFDLPDNFTGNLSHLAGRNLGYDVLILDHVPERAASAGAFAAITGANGMVLEARPPIVPTTEEWRRLSVNLSEGSWRVAGENRFATQAEIASVLSNVTQTQMKAEFFGFYDETAIRNIGVR